MTLTLNSVLDNWLLETVFRASPNCHTDFFSRGSAILYGSFVWIKLNFVTALSCPNTIILLYKELQNKMLCMPRPHTLSCVARPFSAFLTMLTFIFVPEFMNVRSRTLLVGPYLHESIFAWKYFQAPSTPVWSANTLSEMLWEFSSGQSSFTTVLPLINQIYRCNYTIVGKSSHPNKNTFFWRCLCIWFFCKTPI